MKKDIVLAFALLCAMCAACSSDNTSEPKDNERKDVVLTRSQQELVATNNNFAFNLFRVAAAGNESQVLSPLSVTYALGMLNNGATGETQQQINDALGFRETGADGVNEFCKKMLAEAPKLDKLTKVIIANNIYMNKDYELKADFVSKANDYYNAQPETRDFADGKTRDVINQWGSQQTQKMIPEVLAAQEFDVMAVSYLLNATYFKGEWQLKFDKSSTKNEPFTLEGGKGETTVPMMHQEENFGIAAGNNCQLLRMPYGNGAYTMTIVLPNEGSTVNEVLQTLTAEQWSTYQQQLARGVSVDVKLPRFETSTSVSLKDAMKRLGVTKAFTDKAEFGNFCNVPTHISFMKQAARIKVNEDGAEAAAVTAIGMTYTSAGPTQSAVFHATRPFLYAISEQSTGAIFFIGKYTGE